MELSRVRARLSKERTSVVGVRPRVGAVSKALIGEVVENSFVRVLLRAKEDKVFKRVRSAYDREMTDRVSRGVGRRARSRASYTPVSSKISVPRTKLPLTIGPSIPAQTTERPVLVDRHFWIGVDDLGGVNEVTAGAPVTWASAQSSLN